MPEGCIFCAIVAKSVEAATIFEDDTTMAFMDLRQFHQGHALIIPKSHLHDLRDCDPATGAALMSLLIRVTQAVGEAFSSEGITIWHSIGAAANQEVPHLHLHVHPRKMHDDLLRFYPSHPARPGLPVLREWAAQIKARL